MDGERPDITTIAKRARKEHVQLLNTLIRLARSAEGLKPEGPNRILYDRLRQQISSLAADLERHFRHEEESHLLEGLEERLPHAQAELARLREQHNEILAFVHAARERSRSCTPLQIQGLAEDVYTVLEMLLAHENSEDRLLAQAVSTEPPGHPSFRPAPEEPSE